MFQIVLLHTTFHLSRQNVLSVGGLLSGCQNPADRCDVLQHRLLRGDLACRKAVPPLLCDRPLARPAAVCFESPPYIFRGHGSDLPIRRIPRRQSLPQTPGTAMPSLDSAPPRSGGAGRRRRYVRNMPSNIPPETQKSALYIFTELIVWGRKQPCIWRFSCFHGIGYDFKSQQDSWLV